MTMIHVDAVNKIIFLHGINKHLAIVLAVEAETGKKWRNRHEWTTVGIADDLSKGIITGLAFDPPRVEQEPIGFKIYKPKTE